MNRALLYLWFCLLKRRLLDFIRSLRRPATLAGFAAVLWLLGVLFWFRNEEVFRHLVEHRILMTGALLMVVATLIKGFWQRGLVFEPPDIEFVFTSPFTQRQIVCYRLLPNYLYALIQGIVLAALLAPHLAHPLLMAVGLTLFQIICFHLATAASLFAGTLPEDLHHRLRCLMLGAAFLLTALYFRAAWGVRFIPAFALSPVAQLMFYPAVTLPEVARSPALQQWALCLSPTGDLWLRQLWLPVLYLAALAVGAGVSLWGLFQLKANLFEPSLAITSRAAERRLRLRQGRDLATAGKTEAASAGLPTLSFFGGVGAIIWKNLLAARRSQHQLLVAVLLTALNAGGLVALLRHIHAEFHAAPAAQLSSPQVVTALLTFHLGLAFWMAILAPFLQRIFPFDFRRDGRHLLDFRTLPLSPLWLVLAEVAVPVACVLLCQAAGLIPLFIYARFDWPMLLLLIFAYPAIALALSSVWNLYYLLSATRRAAGHAQSPSAAGTVMVVFVSFLVFVPAVWTARFLARFLSERAGVVLSADSLQGLVNFDAWLRFLHSGIPLSGAGALGVQYLVDFLLLLALARLFQRAEVSHDS
ncbi:membrane hypothetical protein [Verrucomicrobia bacterium]|nr:membrane hypothetical protein [Verrucomicrobiota bacterium]